MNKNLILLGTALIAVSFLLSSAEAQSSRRPTYDLNVRKPIDAIVSRVKALLTDLNDKLLNLLILVGQIAPCLSGLIPPEEYSPAADFVLDAFASMNLKDMTAYQQELATKLNEIPAKRLLENVNFEGYCNTSDFKIIHEFVWHEDDQLPDLLAFFFKFGSPDIYEIVKNLYVANGCPQELIDDLPTSPPPKDQSRSQHYSNDHDDVPDLREQMLKPKKPRKQECNITRIIELFPETGIIELVQLLNTVTREFTTNPSTHFLVGKIQEPIKGDSVRKFRDLEPIQTILSNIHQQLVNDPDLKPLFEFIKEVLGIDFFEINIVELVLNIVLFIIWPSVPFN